MGIGQWAHLSSYRYSTPCRVRPQPDPFHHGRPTRHHPGTRPLATAAQPPTPHAAAGFGGTHQEGHAGASAAHTNYNTRRPCARFRPETAREIISDAARFTLFTRHWGFMEFSFLLWSQSGFSSSGYRWVSHRREMRVTNPSRIQGSRAPCCCCSCCCCSCCRNPAGLRCTDAGRNSASKSSSNNDNKQEQNQESYQ